MEDLLWIGVVKEFNAFFATLIQIGFHPNADTWIEKFKKM